MRNIQQSQYLCLYGGGTKKINKFQNDLTSGSVTMLSKALKLVNTTFSGTQ
jgi:hypothetical protein